MRKRGADRLRKMVVPAGLDHGMARAPRPAFYGGRPARGEHDVAMPCHTMHKGGMGGGAAGCGGCGRQAQAWSACRPAAVWLQGCWAHRRVSERPNIGRRPLDSGRRGRPLKMHLSS